MDQLPPACSLLGIEPSPRAGARTRNGTGGLQAAGRRSIPRAIPARAAFFLFTHKPVGQGPLLLCSRNCDKPRLIEALKTKRVRDIACGSSHSAALTSSGELYTWGLGEYGRLGHGDNTTQLKPKMVSTPERASGLGPGRSPR